MAVTAACLALLGDVAPAPDALLGYLPWALPPLGFGLLLYLRARQRARPPQRHAPQPVPPPQRPP